MQMTFISAACIMPEKTTYGMNFYIAAEEGFIKPQEDKSKLAGKCICGTQTCLETLYGL